jgi:hypothetical protein
VVVSMEFFEEEGHALEVRTQTWLKKYETIV